jgi:hypothetical protein
LLSIQDLNKLLIDRDVGKSEITKLPRWARVNKIRETSFIQNDSTEKQIQTDKLPEILKDKVKLIDSIIDINKETVEKVFENIKEEDVPFVSSVIEHAASIRIKSIDSIFALYTMLSKKYGFKPEPFNDSFDLLRQQYKIINIGVNKQNAFIVSYPKGSIEEAIREDDVDAFGMFVAAPNFNKDAKVILPYDISKECYLIEFIALFGSTKCFKQAILSHDFDFRDVKLYAIAGGNNEIIHILEQKDVSFNNCFEVAVKYHRDDLCNWLLLHYKCQIVHLTKSLRWFNYKSLWYTTEKTTYPTKDILKAAIEFAENCSCVQKEAHAYLSEKYDALVKAENQAQAN